MLAKGLLWMLFKETLHMALVALWANKMRSILTMLGIIIGVGAVIAMVSIGMGVRKQVQDSIASLGSNMLVINASATRNSAGVRQAAGSNIRLKLEDAQAIKKKIKDAEYVSPQVQRNYQIVNGNQNWNTQVVGVIPDYMYIRSLSIANGTFISEKDVDNRARVAVIGTTVAENLFGEGINPVGKNIRINNDPFKVIGILESKGQSSMGQDQDDVVIIPITTATTRIMAINHIQQISVQVISPDKMDLVQAEIENLMRQRHKISADKEDDFTVRNLTSIMETMTNTSTMLTILLASIAGISLLVGGIGIMNIMMVSVTERTREIGIRKALGATYRNIMFQFLIEAVFVGIIGGLIGIVVGCSLSMAIAQFAGFTTVITIEPILISFLFSVGISLFFGIYPARKAAKLDPIEALRYE